MTGIFVAIANSWHEPGALVAIGAAPLDDEVSPIAALSVSQMDGSQYAGEVERMTVANGQIALRARITDAVAAKKVAAGVYCGFGVITAAGEVQRIALVDHPSVIGKASARPALLKLGKGFSMRKDRYAAADRDLALAERRLVALRPQNPTDARRRLETLHDVRYQREKLAAAGSMGVDLGGAGRNADAAALAVVRDALAAPMGADQFMRFLNRYADH